MLLHYKSTLTWSTGSFIIIYNLVLWIKTVLLHLRINNYTLLHLKKHIKIRIGMLCLCRSSFKTCSDQTASTINWIATNNSYNWTQQLHSHSIDMPFHNTTQHNQPPKSYIPLPLLVSCRHPRLCGRDLIWHQRLRLSFWCSFCVAPKNLRDLHSYHIIIIAWIAAIQCFIV